MPYIYSTKSNSTAYAFYDASVKDKDSPEVIKKIVVKGGAHVANKNFVTPKGVVTKVTDEEYKLLLEHPVFKRHVERGFVLASTKEYKSKKAINDMNDDDKSAPLTPKKLEAEQKRLEKEAKEKAANDASINDMIV